MSEGEPEGGPFAFQEGEMSKHTDGPWEAKTGGIVQGGGKTLFVAPLAAFYPNHVTGEAEVMANTHLAAAAPDLLAACKAAYSAIQQTPLWQKRGFNTWIDELEAAISAAEPEQRQAGGE